MYKDNFYYVLKERLEYAHDYVKDSSTFLKSVDFQKKVEIEFYKDKKVLLFLTNIVNLPINICGYIKELRSVLGYQKCLKEIEVLQKELNIYD